MNIIIYQSFQVPQQDASGNDCGFYTALFLKYFMEVIETSAKSMKP